MSAFEGVLGTLDGSFASSYNFTVPAGGVPAGNHLMIGLFLNSTAANLNSVTDSRGNTYVIDNDFVGTFVAVHLYSVSARIATALLENDTITFTLSQVEGIAATLLEFSAMATSAFFDQFAEAHVTFSTSHSSGLTPQTAQADEVCVGFHVWDDEVQTWTPHASYTEDNERTAQGQRCVTQHKIVAATGQYESNGTTSASVASENIVATYKGATADVILPHTWRTHYT